MAETAEYVQKVVPEKTYFGRRKILADYKQEELDEKAISKILTDKWSQHEANANEIDYLYKYYKGNQRIFCSGI